MFTEIAQGIAVSLFRIAVVLILGLALYNLLLRIAPRVACAATLAESLTTPVTAAQRRDTLVKVMTRSGQWVIVAIVGFTILGQIGINIAPALAGAGIAGIAIGFGAQGLVRDIISGIFILLDDVYRTGETVRVAGVTGVVEDISLRHTILRDMDGTVHYIPNGLISMVSNLTREWSRINLDVGVAYSTDIDKVKDVINRVGDDMTKDPYFGPLITEPPHFERLDSFEASGVVIKIFGTTLPTRQWEVTGELRGRILKAFAENGIEIKR
ncbi:MAG: mechanosensitive ion channel family protein [Dehalococcoidia bacterium]|nr:mechanosensitive ion channel family protein [Dehalococcoidia bacterium]